MRTLIGNRLIFSAFILMSRDLVKCIFPEYVFCLNYKHDCKLCKCSDWIIFHYFFMTFGNFDDTANREFYHVLVNIVIPISNK